jgi:hypothetical protein
MSSQIVVFVLLGIISFVAVQVRKAQARKRLEELDSGKRCMACNGTNVETFRGKVRCNNCGHTVSLAGLQSSHISDKELTDLVKPDDHRS